MPELVEISEWYGKLFTSKFDTLLTHLLVTVNTLERSSNSKSRDGSRDERMRRRRHSVVASQEGPLLPQDLIVSTRPSVSLPQTHIVKL